MTTRSITHTYFWCTRTFGTWSGRRTTPTCLPWWRRRGCTFSATWSRRSPSCPLDTSVVSRHLNLSHYRGEFYRMNGDCCYRAISAQNRHVWNHQHFCLTWKCLHRTWRSRLSCWTRSSAIRKTRPPTSSWSWRSSHYATPVTFLTRLSFDHKYKFLIWYPRLTESNV